MENKNLIISPNTFLNENDSNIVQSTAAPNFKTIEEHAKSLFAPDDIIKKHQDKYKPIYFGQIQSFVGKITGQTIIPGTNVPQVGSIETFYLLTENSNIITTETGDNLTIL